MTAISANKTESLLPAKQVLYRIIQSSSIIVWEYFDEDAEATRLAALRILKEFTKVNIRCDEPIPMARAPLNLKDLLPPEGLPLPFDFQCKEGYKLEKIESGVYSGRQSASITISEAKGANFMLSFDQEKQICYVDLRYRANLPVQVKVGNPRVWPDQRGVPTAKVMMKLLIDKLRMTSQNVKTIISVSNNAQTVVDVVHALLVEGDSIQQAIAKAHTSQLNAELGQMLGAHEVRLVSAKNADFSTACDLAELIRIGSLPEIQKQTFLEQCKLREIKQLTGVDLLCDGTRLPLYVDLVYAVTP